MEHSQYEKAAELLLAAKKVLGWQGAQVPVWAWPPLILLAWGWGPGLRCGFRLHPQHGTDLSFVCVHMCV